MLTGTISETGTTNSHTFKIVLPPDSNVGTSSANYSLSNAIYGAAYIGNPAFQYYVDGASVDKATFLAAMGNSSTDDGTTAMNQVFHDLASGYNFGLIGNNQVPKGSNLSLNDMGSAGWRQLQAMPHQRPDHTQRSGPLLPHRFQRRQALQPVGGHSLRQLALHLRLRLFRLPPAGGH